MLMNTHNRQVGTPYVVLHACRQDVMICCCFSSTNLMENDSALVMLSLHSLHVKKCKSKKRENLVVYVLP